MWTQLILFCWRLFDNDNTGTEYLLEQREYLIQLRDIIYLGEGSDDDVDAAILNLSISLIKHSDFQQVRSAIKYFCGIKGYKMSESRWRRPSEYTSTISTISALSTKMI